MMAKNWAGWWAFSALMVACTSALAQHSSAETKEDAARHRAMAAARHRAMAAAHEAAAKCLEAGKGENVCVAELQLACKGLAIGKYCGMKHAH